MQGMQGMEIRQVRERCADLTVKETAILRLVADGYSDDEIATRCKVSVHTIHTHLRNLLRKTGCTNRVLLARYAVAHGLVPVLWLP